MTSHFGRRAVVNGASMAGMPAARVVLHLTSGEQGMIAIDGHLAEKNPSP